VKLAGAVMLGKLNLDEFAFAGSGTTSGYGPTRNPWNESQAGHRQAHRRPWQMVFVSPLPAPMTAGRCGFPEHIAEWWASRHLLGA
jgi:hypothetical protein